MFDDENKVKQKHEGGIKRQREKRERERERRWEGRNEIMKSEPKRAAETETGR